MPGWTRVPAAPGLRKVMGGGSHGYKPILQKTGNGRKLWRELCRYGSAILIVFLQLYPRDPPTTAADFEGKIPHITSMTWSYCP